MALSFLQADAIIEQLTARVHELIGTDYRDAAIDAASHAKASEGAAKSSENNAKASEANAKTSEANAKTSENNAKKSEGGAKASEGESTSQAELSTEAAAISALSALAFDQLVGEGFPEGKVEAPVGSIYTDRLATNGAIRWIKTSGTGNTGWQVEWGDTGWRDVTQHLQDPAPISGNFYIRRVNGVVSVRFDELTFEDTSGGFLQWNDLLPQGYNKGTPGFDFHELSAQHLHDSVDGPLRTARNGAVVIYMYGSVKSKGVVRGAISFPASGGWPHTSAGTPS